MVVVSLPPALLRLFPAAGARVEVEAATAAEAIDALDARWPGLRSRLCISRSALRPHINLFVGTQRAGLDTPLAPGAEVTILLAVMS